MSEHDEELRHLFSIAEMRPCIYDECHSILRSGADVYATESISGYNLFLQAVSSAAPAVKVLQLLVNFGVDPCFTTSNGTNAFHAVMSAEPWADPRAEVLRYISELGVDINARDSHGELPVTLAIENGLPQEVRALCELGARLDLLAPCLGDEWWSEDSTALESVVHRLVRSLRPQPEALQALIDHGAPLHFTDLLGQTPLEVAQDRLGSGPAPATGTRREVLAKCVEILQRVKPRR